MLAVASYILKEIKNWKCKYSRNQFLTAWLEYQFIELFFYQQVIAYAKVTGE